MHPFKRPRLRAVDDNQDANPTKAGLEHVQQSRTGSDWSSHKTSAMRSSSSGSTFDEIRSPSVAGVERALLELPRVTQPLRYPVRFRKQIGTDEDIEWTFKQVFHKQQYKGKQQEIMKASLQGSDIVVIAPTGMGKSLCFQVPAVAEKHGLTLVVSPLLSLMHDQIAALRQLQVPCAMLSSKTSQEEQREILRDLTSGHPKNRLLYITPERLSSAPFCKKLQILYRQQEFNRLVIDEAHCISEWGHDFRPEYAKLGNFRVEFPKVPIMALTASATPKVQEDIAVELGLEPDLLFKVIHPFNRPNLFYEIRYYSEQSDPPSSYRQNDILAFIQKTAARGGSERPCAGIIYCRAKKTCDELAAFLRGKGIFAAPYHRGLKDYEADANQQKWVNNDELAAKGLPRVDCVVATIAFGMGIDKSNCRYVVHYDIPKSFEGYYQETGRAGRDGHAARCVLYYSAEDKLRIQELVRKTYSSRERRAERENAVMPSQRAPNSIDALLSYCENVRVCRHVTICRYFGEKATEADAHRYCDRICDVCRDPKRTRRRREEGLVTLDFAATQAVEREVEEPDFDDFYEAPAQAGLEANREEASDSDEEGGLVTGERSAAGFEGFRTAAVEYKGRDPDGNTSTNIQLARENGAARGSSPARRPTSVSSERSIGHPEVQMLEVSDDDEGSEDEAVPAALQPLIARAQEYRVEPAAAPSPPQNAVELDSDDEDLPMLDDIPRPRLSQLNPNVPAPASLKKIAQVKPTALINKPGNQVMGQLPPPNILPKPIPAFETPFLDPTRRPNYKEATGVKTPGDASSSVGEDPPKRIDLEPSITDKKIGSKMRKEAVTLLVKHLQRALLSKHGIRSSKSEEAVWAELGVAPGTSHDKRRSIILASAIEIESDLFWTSLTGDGYRLFLHPRIRAARLLQAKDERLPGNDDADVGFVVAALKRAVGANKAGKKRKRKVVEVDSGDEESS